MVSARSSPTPRTARISSRVLPFVSGSLTKTNVMKNATKPTFGKKAYLVRQHGEGAVGAMRAVKRALDPLNILNPDKVVDVAA